MSRDHDEFTDEPLPEDEGRTAPAPPGRHGTEETQHHDDPGVRDRRRGAVVRLLRRRRIHRPAAHARGRGEDSRKNQLLAIGLAYFDYVKTHEQRAPAKAEDLRPLLTETPGAYEALADGSVVFVYGISPDEMVPPGPEGFPVLAYDKNTPESGGWVVYANGEVEQVTAAEFASKPKLRKRGEK